MFQTYFLPYYLIPGLKAFRTNLQEEEITLEDTRLVEYDDVFIS